MSEGKRPNSAVKLDNQASKQQDGRLGTEGQSRRNFLAVGSASLATAALASLAVNAQEPATCQTPKCTEGFCRLVRRQHASN
jgi:hypothetical protein